MGVGVGGGVDSISTKVKKTRELFFFIYENLDFKVKLLNLL